MTFIFDVDEVVKEVRKKCLYSCYLPNKGNLAEFKEAKLSVKSIEFRNKTLNSDCDFIETLNWKPHGNSVFE